MKRAFPAFFLFLSVCSALLIGCGKNPTQPCLTLQFDPEHTDPLLSFAVISDRTGNAVPGVYARTVQMVERYHPDIAVSIGDMIEGYTDDTVSIKHQWEEHVGLVEPLTMPIYFTAGNHDIWDTLSLVFYERYIGQPCRSITINGVHMISLDNSRYNGIQDFPIEQIGWLIDDLRANTDAAQTFVFMHIPYWIYTVAKKKPDLLHIIFVRYGVDAVFTGHLYKHIYGRYDGIT